MPERYLGKTLGKYRVEELIGSGGFAWVYRGYDPSLEIPVALKVLKPQFAGDPTFDERFRREASMAARLRHPNIVKIYEVGRDGDAVFFAMDYHPSGLASRLDAMPFLAEEFVLKVGLDVSRALGFAHREGVIHRDIKVDNILFDVHGNAVVCDFGIARVVSGYTQQTGTNMVVGTPQYFAPEQARAKPLDGRADIYSLGVSMYRAATGRLPFDGDDWYEIARAHVEDSPARPRSINPAISPAFEQLLLRCLAKHPDDRPATAEQLADEIAETSAHPGTVPRATGSGSSGLFLSPTETPTVTERAVSRGRRGKRSAAKRAALVAMGLIVLAAGALPLATAWRARQPVPPPLPTPRIEGATLVLAQRVVDSLRPDSLVDPIGAVIAGIAQRDSARSRAKPRLLRLQVAAPEAAAVTVNGTPVGTGQWSADTLKPGSYTVRAMLETIEGCTSARDEQTIQLRAGGAPQRVLMAVAECGTLMIVVTNTRFPKGARFSLAGENGVRRDGTLPLGGALVLPTGVYQLRLSADKPCEDYEEPQLRITAERPVTKRIPMLCEVAGAVRP